MTNYKLEEVLMAKEQTMILLASASAGISASNGVTSFLNENAGILSLGIGLLSLIFTVIFAYLGYKVRKNANKLNAEKEEHDKIKRELEIEKLRAEISTLNDINTQQTQ
jgi:hypothetical protein